MRMNRSKDMKNTDYQKNHRLSRSSFRQSNAIAERESTLLTMVSIESATSKSITGSNFSSTSCSSLLAFVTNDSSKSYRSGRKFSSMSSMLIDVDDGVEYPSLRCDDEMEMESSSLSFLLEQIRIPFLSSAARARAKTKITRSHSIRHSSRGHVLFNLSLTALQSDHSRQIEMLNGSRMSTLLS